MTPEMSTPSRTETACGRRGRPRKRRGSKRTRIETPVRKRHRVDEPDSDSTNVNDPNLNRNANENHIQNDFPDHEEDDDDDEAVPSNFFQDFEARDDTPVRGKRTKKKKKKEKKLFPSSNITDGHYNTCDNCLRSEHSQLDLKLQVLNDVSFHRNSGFIGHDDDSPFNVVCYSCHLYLTSDTSKFDN